MIFLTVALVVDQIFEGDCVDVADIVLDGVPMCGFVLFCAFKLQKIIINRLLCTQFVILTLNLSLYTCRFRSAFNVFFVLGLFTSQYWTYVKTFSGCSLIEMGHHKVNIAT
jgi:hypothetical protein